tara:strand:- start:4424 stop:5041 length:618 start_codon:yes stop_codon:yes gene_type:complete
MQNVTSCRRKIVRWNQEFIIAVRRLVLANATDAIRALGLEVSEQELLRKLSVEELVSMVRSRSTAPWACKNYDLVEIKKMYPSHKEPSGSEQFEAMGLSHGNQVVGEILRTMNASFLIVAKELVALDRRRAATWLKLSDQECDLVADMSVEEILHVRSAFQRILLLRRGPNLGHLVSPETDFHRFQAIGASLLDHSSIGGFEDVF